MGHSMLQSGDLCHQFSQISRALASFSCAIFSEFLIESLSFIFLQLLDKSIFHFCQKTTVKLVPFCRFEVALFENCAFSENVDVAADVQVPAADDFSCMFLFSWVDFFYVVFGVFNDNFMRLPVKSINNWDLVSFSIFNPPRFKPQTFNIIYTNLK